MFHKGKKLKQKDVYNALSHCPICLSEEKRTSIAVIQNEPKIEMLLCDECKGISASLMPRGKIIEQYYENYYKNNDLGVTFHNTDRFAKHILEKIKIDHKNKISILDFGGGNGDLAKDMAKRLIDENSKLAINITLVDYDPRIDEDNIPTNIKFEIKREIREVYKKYDIVLASAVLEHIPKLNSVIKKLFTLLKNNGFFYARTPHMVPYKKIFKGLDLTYPAHVHDLGASFWARFGQTFSLKTKVIISQPAIVETEFKKAFVPTLSAFILKFPAYLELGLSKKRKDLLWDYYGGWEIILKKIGK